MENKRKWRWGTNRWFVFLFMALAIIGASFFPAISPHIQVAPEKLTEHPLFTLPIIGEFIPTNTIVAVLLVDVILIAMALAVRAATRSGEMVPKGVSGAVEALMEVLYNLTESTAGKWAKTIFPYFATITLMVLMSNWLELIPGVDSIGKIEPSAHGYLLRDLTSGIAAIVKGGEVAAGQGYNIVPFVRVPIHRSELHSCPGDRFSGHDPGHRVKGSGSALFYQILQLYHAVHKTGIRVDGSVDLHPGAHLRAFQTALILIQVVR